VNRGFLMRAAWIAAVALLVAGALATIGSLGGVRETRERLGRKLRELEQLRAIKREIDRHEGAVRIFEGLNEKRPVSLMVLLQETVPGHKAVDTREAVEDLVSGWIVRRREVTLEEVPWDSMTRFIRAAEATRPPRRLVKCSVRPSAQPGRSGRVALTFETIEKSD